MFAQEGAKVVAVSRRLDPIRETANLITSNGGEAIYHPTDVSKVDQIKEMVKKTLDTFGKLDIVFANAGISPSRTNIVDTPEESWQMALDTNLTGVFLTCKYSIPPMIDNGGGSIIVTSSQVGLVAQKDRIPYGATKGGVTHLVKCMALDCAPYNIRVNAICPGRIPTELNIHLPDWEERSKLYPLGLKGKVEDIAYGALYLASDESSWVTGIALPIDGGFILQ
jgi:NAD(P)-dependent dehydrogenase (short-subunit alcohol dehydrogenase family)